MVYLNHLNGQVKQYKDSETKTVNYLLSLGIWKRVKGLKDDTPCSEPKSVSKKSKKTKKKAK